MGEDKNFFLIDDIKALVDMLCIKHRIDSIITAGSSKGGTSALFYGLLLNAEYIVSGAPQYYIGDYLIHTNKKALIERIMGDASQNSIEQLNTIVYDQIKKSSGIGVRKLYLHYSPCEHTYFEHVQYMISDLKEYGFNVVEDNEYTYTDHMEVAKYFRPFLRYTITDICR